MSHDSENATDQIQYESEVTNPFSTRFSKPSSVQFLEFTDCSLSTCLSRIDNAGFVGQIVGPHGSGKSTLLFALANELARLSPVLLVNGTKQVFRAEPNFSSETPSTSSELGFRKDFIVLADGWESHFLKSKKRIVKLLKDRASPREVADRLELSLGVDLPISALVVATHFDVGLPIVTSLSPSLEKFLCFAKQLQARSQHQVPDDRVRQAFDQASGNYREGLMHLYDAWEDLFGAAHVHQPPEVSFRESD